MSNKNLFSISLTGDQLTLLVSILEEQMRRCGAAYELKKLIKGYGSISDYLSEVEPVQTLLTEINIQFTHVVNSDLDDSVFLKQRYGINTDLNNGNISVSNKEG